MEGIFNWLYAHIVSNIPPSQVQASIRYPILGEGFTNLLLICIRISYETQRVLSEYQKSDISTNNNLETNMITLQTPVPGYFVAGGCSCRKRTSKGKSRVKILINTQKNKAQYILLTAYLFEDAKQGTAAAIKHPQSINKHPIHGISMGQCSFQVSKTAVFQGVQLGGCLG